MNHSETVLLLLRYGAATNNSDDGSNTSVDDAVIELWEDYRCNVLMLGKAVDALKTYELMKIDYSVTLKRALASVLRKSMSGEISPFFSPVRIPYQVLLAAMRRIGGFSSERTEAISFSDTFYGRNCFADFNVSGLCSAERVWCNRSLEEEGSESEGGGGIANGAGQCLCGYVD